ncbi:hypothetical protein JOD55_001147 [Arcanobacterium pluranimalium]|nr:hypothetical protein [Arcanobacterium pluranimalium]
MDTNSTVPPHGKYVPQAWPKMTNIITGRGQIYLLRAFQAGFTCIYCGYFVNLHPVPSKAHLPSTERGSTNNDHVHQNIAQQ